MEAGVRALHSQQPRIHDSDRVELSTGFRAPPGRAPAREEILRRIRWLMGLSLLASVLLGVVAAVLIADNGLSAMAVGLLTVAAVAILWLTRRVSSGVEKVFKRQDRLLRAAVHELYSPLSWVKASIEAGLTGTLSGPESLSMAHDAATDLHQLIADLVEAAQVISGTEMLPADPVDPVEIVNMVASRGTDTEAVIEAVIEVSADGDPPAVLGSASLLRRAVSNLVRNAARHGYGGRAGTIMIRVHEEGITVSDTGVGVARAQLDQLRRDVPLGISTEAGGAGLGLALVGWVAAVHGGSLTLEPNVPQGLRATIELPESETGSP